MQRRIASLLALLVALAGLAVIGPMALSSPAQAKDMNCSDFDTQADAQNYFNNNGGGPNNNVDGLDSDGDGIVCESNPCPCANGGGGGGGNPPPPGPKAKVTINFAADGAKSFRLFGALTPKANKRLTILQRATKAGGRFVRFRATKTNAQGKYLFKNLKSEGFYRVTVGGATSNVKHICKGSCG